MLTMIYRIKTNHKKGPFLAVHVLFNWRTFTLGSTDVMLKKAPGSGQSLQNLKRINCSINLVWLDLELENAFLVLDTAMEVKVLANKDESKCLKPLIAVNRPVRDR